MKQILSNFFGSNENIKEETIFPLKKKKINLPMEFSTKLDRQAAAKHAAKTVLLRNRKKVFKVVEKLKSQGKTISVAIVAKKAKMTEATTRGHLKALNALPAKITHNTIFGSLSKDEQKLIKELLYCSSEEQLPLEKIAKINTAKLIASIYYSLSKYGASSVKVSFLNENNEWVNKRL